MRERRTYRSRVDWWLGLLLVAVPLGALATAIPLTASGDAGAAIVGWAVLAAVIGLYVGIVWPVRYELAEDALVVRFGLVRSRIPYMRIRGAAPTRSILAAPALSMDRLALDTGMSLPLIISPERRDAFLDDLAARVPLLVRDGDRLVAAEGGG